MKNMKVMRVAMRMRKVVMRIVKRSGKVIILI